MRNLVFWLRAQLLIYIIEGVKPVVKLFYHPEPWTITLPSLREFPVGSLGWEVARYLDDRQFDLLSHYETHDIKHVLLEYEMTAEGEVRMQCFLLGNGNTFVSVLGTVAVGLLLMPELWPTFYRDYQRGRNGLNVSRLDFAQIIHQRPADLRKKLSL